MYLVGSTWFGLDSCQYELINGEAAQSHANVIGVRECAHPSVQVKVCVQIMAYSCCNSSPQRIHEYPNAIYIALVVSLYIIQPIKKFKAKQHFVVTIQEEI